MTEACVHCGTVSWIQGWSSFNHDSAFCRYPTLHDGDCRICGHCALTSATGLLAEYHKAMLEIWGHGMSKIADAAIVKQGAYTVQDMQRMITLMFDQLSTMVEEVRQGVND